MSTRRPQHQQQQQRNNNGQSAQNNRQQQQSKQRNSRSQSRGKANQQQQQQQRRIMNHPEQQFQDQYVGNRQYHNQPMNNRGQQAYHPQQRFQQAASPIYPQGNQQYNNGGMQGMLPPPMHRSNQTGGIHQKHRRLKQQQRVQFQQGLPQQQHYHNNYAQADYYDYDYNNRGGQTQQQQIKNKRSASGRRGQMTPQAQVQQPMLNNVNMNYQQQVPIESRLQQPLRNQNNQKQNPERQQTPQVNGGGKRPQSSPRFQKQQQQQFNSLQTQQSYNQVNQKLNITKRIRPGKITKAKNQNQLNANGSKVAKKTLRAQERLIAKHQVKNQQQNKTRQQDGQQNQGGGKQNQQKQQANNKANGNSPQKQNNQQKAQAPSPKFNMKNAVLPVTNPTGNPFPNPLKLPNEKQLKTLQVKLVLNKLTEPPRCYAEKIKMDENNDMQIDTTTSRRGRGGQLTLADRFEKIQDAKRAIPFMALKQSNKQQQSGEVQIRDAKKVAQEKKQQKKAKADQKVQRLKLTGKTLRLFQKKQGKQSDDEALDRI